MTEKLSKSAWVLYGLEVLARDGPNALRVGIMAADLGVSRGSFYWHFRDVSDFKAQVLHHWETTTTDTVFRKLEADEYTDRLSQLVLRAFTSRRDLDRAFRAWAASSPAVAVVVAREDDRRIAFIAELLVETGVAADCAGVCARFLYWAYLGHAMIADTEAAILTTGEIKDIIELFERRSGA